LKLAVWLSGIVDYDQVEEILAKVGQITISDSSVWRQAQVWGAGFQALVEAERIRSNLLPGRWGAPCKRAEPKGRMGVSMDGGMIHIRDEGWKELKVGSLFDVEVRPTRDKETGDWVELAHAVRNSHVAHLGGPEIFGQMVWAEAARRDWEQAADTEVVADGAPWIWNLALDYFYDSRQVVDRYHATEHLAEAARLLKGEETLAKKRWLNARETTLFEGHVARIVLELEAVARDQPSIAEALKQRGRMLPQEPAADAVSRDARRRMGDWQWDGGERCQTVQGALRGTRYALESLRG
jgi:hypothetical protein